MGNFFDKRFWQNVLIASISQLIVLTIAIFVSMYIGNSLERLTDLFESVDGALARVESVVTGLDPAEIALQADALNQGAQVIGEGVGDGGAEVLDRVGNAWKEFKNDN